jgi:arsenate reductase-like glutaredoxin family protein
MGEEGGVGAAREPARADVAQNPGARKANLDEAEALALLEENTSAIKRPIVEFRNKLLIGFDPAEFERTF